MLSKKLTVFLIILSGVFCSINTYAQLWSYIGLTPAKEKAFEKRLKKEAYKVITHYDVDKFPYDEMIYRVQSLDSSICYIQVWECPFGDKFTIKCETDSLKISECKGYARIHLLRKNLLEIVYSPRGGSDDGYENVLLIAIRNGKFRIAMEIQTVHDYDGPGFYGLDETHLILTGTTPQSYQLTLKRRDYRKYDKKSKDFDHHYSTKLKYDDKLDLFYTTTEKINGSVWDDDTNEFKKKITATAPVINFGDYKYCFITDCWYIVGEDFQTKKPTLVNFSYRPNAKS